MLVVFSLPDLLLHFTFFDGACFPVVCCGRRVKIYVNPAGLRLASGNDDALICEPVAVRLNQADDILLFFFNFCFHIAIFANSPNNNFAVLLYASAAALAVG